MFSIDVEMNIIKLPIQPKLSLSCTSHVHREGDPVDFSLSTLHTLSKHKKPKWMGYLLTEDSYRAVSDIVGPYASSMKEEFHMTAIFNEKHTDYNVEEYLYNCDQLPLVNLIADQLVMTKDKNLVVLSVAPESFEGIASHSNPLILHFLNNKYLHITIWADGDVYKPKHASTLLQAAGVLAYSAPELIPFSPPSFLSLSFSSSSSRYGHMKKLLKSSKAIDASNRRTFMGKRKACKFLLTTTGCRKGDLCTFDHSIAITSER
jgi:hypothetical protein